MFNSNAMYSTSGYGQQVAQLLPDMKADGHDIGIINFFGSEGGIFELNGILQFPKIGGQWGDDAMLHHSKAWNPDVIFSHQDIWTLNPNLLQQLKRWIPIVPIDHEPPPPAVVDRLRLAYRVVVYSKFGKEQLSKLGIYSRYIPLTVDTSLVTPPPNKEELKKRINIPPDFFIFGMVAANKDNPPRKSFQEVMDAFAQYVKKYPKSGLYIHTFLDQPGGFPIPYYAKHLGIEKHMFYLDPYTIMFKVGRKDIKNIYGAFDCYIGPSTNEGFGVPLIEAQACEVPVITNNWTAMPELIIPEKTGFLTKILNKRFTPMLGYVAVPDPASILDCMMKVTEADRKKMGTAGREYVIENYDRKVVFDKMWRPFLKVLSSEIDTQNKPQ